MIEVQTIYWLLDNNERVVSVVRTKCNPRTRLNQHRRGKTFTSHRQFVVPAEHACAIEAALIKLLLPPYNAMMEASGSKGDLHYLRMFFQQHFTAVLALAPMLDLPS